MLTDTCATPSGLMASSWPRSHVRSGSTSSHSRCRWRTSKQHLRARRCLGACHRRLREGRAGVAPQQVEGLLTGFIDLVFEAVEGLRGGLQDQSLGNHPEAYISHRLDQAMAEHHYTLQGLIYSVAMSRFFEQRVPDWSEDRWGGIVYLLCVGCVAKRGGWGGSGD